VGNDRATTRAHSTLRIVLRGVPLGEGGKCAIGDLTALILTRAKPTDWPDVEIMKGDLEAVVWTITDDRDRAADQLLEDPRVVSVRVEAEPLEIG
jgi:hypothetical protein